jgi:putative membrane protein
MELLLKFVLSLLVITGLLLILPGIKTKKFYCAIVVAVPITIINMLIAPLMEIYAIPLTTIVFGLIIVILDSLLLWFFGLILKGIKVDAFGWAFLFAVILSLVIYLIELVFEPGYFEIMGAS